MVAVVARYRIVADDGSCRGWLHVTKDDAVDTIPYHYAWAGAAWECREVKSIGGFPSEERVVAFVYRWHVHPLEALVRVGA